MLRVQKIACINNAGFVMNFSIRWLDQNGAWHDADWNSGDYPINQTRVSPDLGSIGVPDNALFVEPFVQPVLSLPKEGHPLVGYEKNGQTAVYEVRGTIFDYDVVLVS
jgi:hypothetical protein